ncbi:6-pyruvoyl tetrahydropterin synthase/QueD family protein [Spizellomyces punctatus DAOM BR117]|uniref:6-pyruvoyl tetrahydrobiopterin synthase n=1 Tax=Spizellomyces punctatus (strain DAOM BR117) TaxID=645134 RepID=A0A0L0HI22_SPIPD|nr:6-pyruvoyl tetrahydropterin synthase/QueD family protein [Spizellomyces punctatus DAOM BR117]KND00469.1 6-pyruvoyl tetrahydropterin synthase/QueD family protein [Spizellomyces punctatus DAOM BR117]|eukprot:XP_016608508.1 6-pyruvoyl tetrahydropterin synthase/QueD family protein [Spizellomyces punctatus DAOM BR117]
MPVAYLSRTEHFSAAHRLNTPKLSEEENKTLYGKCNHRHGHGHNYKVEVIVKGQIDPVTGMVLNITELKECMKSAIIDLMDHKNLDVDVQYFHDKPSTAENIAVFIWDNMQRILPKGELHEIRLHETDNNVVLYRGE